MNVTECLKLCRRFMDYHEDLWPEKCEGTAHHAFRQAHDLIKSLEEQRQAYQRLCDVATMHKPALREELARIQDMNTQTKGAA